MAFVRKKHAAWISYFLHAVAIFVGWVGAMILAVNLELRYTAETFAGTPLDAPAWTGIAYLLLVVPIVYAGSKLGKRYGVIPPERGWF